MIPADFDLNEYPPAEFPPNSSAGEEGPPRQQANDSGPSGSRKRHRIEMPHDNDDLRKQLQARAIYKRGLDGKPRKK
jgi:hypothetical protein